MQNVWWQDETLKAWYAAGMRPDHVSYCLFNAIKENLTTTTIVFHLRTPRKKAAAIALREESSPMIPARRRNCWWETLSKGKRSPLQRRRSHEFVISSDPVEEWRSGHTFAHKISRSAGFVIYFLVAYIPKNNNPLITSSNLFNILLYNTGTNCYSRNQFFYVRLYRYNLASKGPPPFIQVFLLAIPLKLKTYLDSNEYTN